MGTTSAETPGASYRDVEQQSNNAAHKYSKWLKIQGFVIFVLTALVITLFALHFSHDHDDSNLQANVDSTNFGMDQVLSFDANGELTLGAGESFYLSPGELPRSKLKGIAFTGSSHGSPAASNFMVSADDKSSFITPVTVNNENKVTFGEITAEATLESETIKDVVTLSPTLAVVLSQDTKSNCIVYTVFLKDQKPSIVQSSKLHVQSLCATALLGRVSETQFQVISYNYQAATGDVNRYYQQSRIGDISPSDGVITLDQAIDFAWENMYVLSKGTSVYTQFGSPLYISEVSSRVIPYYVETNGTEVTDIGLCFASIQAAKASSVCYKDFLPSNFIDAIQLSDNSVAATFIDRNQNSALVVAVFSYNEGKVLKLRDTYVLTDATGGSYDFGKAYFYTKPSITLLSSSKLVVSFLDASNKGTPTFKVLSLSSTMQLSESTPSIPASTDFSIYSSVKGSSAIILDVIPLSSTSFLFGYAGYIGTETFHSGLSVGDLKEPFQGFTVPADNGEVSLKSSGVVEPGFKLEKGKSYYVTSKGDIVVGETMSRDQQYIHLANDVVVTRDSLVGVAISETQLLLQ